MGSEHPDGPLGKLDKALAWRALTLHAPPRPAVHAVDAGGDAGGWRRLGATGRSGPPAKGVVKRQQACGAAMQPCRPAGDDLHDLSLTRRASSTASECCVCSTAWARTGPWWANAGPQPKPADPTGLAHQGGRRWGRILCRPFSGARTVQYCRQKIKWDGSGCHPCLPLATLAGAPRSPLPAPSRGYSVAASPLAHCAPRGPCT